MTEYDPHNPGPPKEPAEDASARERSMTAEERLAISVTPGDHAFALREHGEACAARAEASLWQPIDTCPRHKEVLFWREDQGVLFGQYTYCAEWVTEEEQEREGYDEDTLWLEDPWVYLLSGVYRCEGDERPTHWRPLPAEPANHFAGYVGSDRVGMGVLRIKPRMSKDLPAGWKNHIAVEGPLSPETVAARLRTCRIACNLRLKDVAEQIGTSPQSVQRLETGGMTLSVYWLLKMCAVLDVEPAEVLRADGEANE